MDVANLWFKNMYLLNKKCQSTYQMFLDNEKRFHMPLSVHSCVRLAYEQPGSPQEQPKLMFADGQKELKSVPRTARRAFLLFFIGFHNIAKKQCF